nr:uncharacterized protein CI109_003464 [Kwoniella shandongensis]KAA5528175.1 hypothetical protein CI109_003464 [Kwoniella shandongensis]
MAAAIHEPFQESYFEKLLRERRNFVDTNHNKDNNMDASLGSTGTGGGMGDLHASLQRPISIVPTYTAMDRPELYQGQSLSPSPSRSEAKAHADPMHPPLSVPQQRGSYSSSSMSSSSSSSFAPPPPQMVQQQKIAPSVPVPSNASTPTVEGERPLSRFQQLLRLKLAAEQAHQNVAAPASGTSHPNNTPLQMTEAFARLQAVDTVMHRDFARRHYTAENEQQQQQQQQAALVKVEEQSLYPQANQPAPFSYGPPPQAAAANMPYSLGAAPSHPPVSPQHSNQYNTLPDSQHMVARQLTGVYTPQEPIFGSVGGQPSNFWSGSYDPSTAYSQPMANDNKANNSHYLPPGPASGQSANGNVVKLDQPWPVKMENYSESSQWKAPVSPPQVVPYNNYQQPRVAPSFSWNVSEVRTAANDQSYLPHQPYSGSRASSPLVSTASSVCPLTPVTPVGPYRYGADAPYPGVKVERSPSASSHLAVPYSSLPGRNMQSMVTPPMGPTDLPPSPILEYNPRMYGAPVHLPGAGMYMTSTNGHGDLPPTLANGMAGGNGGEGSSGGSNNGSTGGGWPNGHGGNGEASGSGSGGHGDGDGSGSGGDGGDGGDDGNGGKKGKKLALACHFCRRRKLKCDGIRPKCDNCTKRNEVCSWDDNVRRRGPGRATKERREKAAREALAAGLTNANSLGAAPPLESSSTPDPGAPLPGSVATVVLQPLEAQFQQEQEQKQQLPQQATLPPPPPGYDDDLPIDPTLAALSAAIMPETLAELETKKEPDLRKRKSDIGLDDESLEKRPRLDDHESLGLGGHPEVQRGDENGNGF